MKPRKKREKPSIIYLIETPTRYTFFPLRLTSLSEDLTTSDDRNEICGRIITKSDVSSSGESDILIFAPEDLKLKNDKYIASSSSGSDVSPIREIHIKRTMPKNIKTTSAKKIYK